MSPNEQQVEFRAGDALVFSGESLISQAIRVFDGAYGYHAALAIVSATIIDAAGETLRKEEETFPRTGEGQVAAVAGTGCDDSHPDLVDGAEGKFVTADSAGHGTPVPGSILGVGAASGGHFRGMAPGARLYGHAIGNEYISEKAFKKVTAQAREPCEKTECCPPRRPETTMALSVRKASVTVTQVNGRPVEDGRTDCLEGAYAT